MPALSARKNAALYAVAAIVLIVFFLQGVPLLAAATTGPTESDAVSTYASAERDKRIVAVLFSVGQNKDILKRFDSVPNLDLFDVNGEPLIKHVYDALHRSKHIQKIVVVAAPEVEKELRLDADPMTSFVIDKRDAAKNVQFGIDEIRKGDLIMFIPSDLPLITPEGLDCLIDRVLSEKDIDVFFPLISRETFEQKYPKKACSYAHFKEGQYTAAHVEFLRPDLFLDHADEVAASKNSLYNVYYMRKSALGMVRFLGLRLTLKYVFGALSPHDVEQLIFDKYRFRAKAIFWNDPDLAADLNEPDDIPMIDNALEQRALAHSKVPPVSPASLTGTDTQSGV